MYHGSSFGSDLTAGNIDPLKHSSGRTPLPAFTMGTKEVAEGYSKTGGHGGNRIFGGPTYRIGLEFDSPERIVNAFDPASDDFINFMRGTLSEDGLRPALVPGGAQRRVNFRNIFDQQISALEPQDRTIYGVINAMNDVHETYRPLGEYDYLPRGQGAIEARKFGIDALRWNDHGDEVMAVLDPDDIRSKVGRKNITSVQDINAIITERAPLPSDPSRLISVDATAAAKIESNIAPPVAKKPSNLGKKTDLRTRPKPKGTDIAAPKVTPHGQVKPPTSVREPVTKVTDSTTAASKTQAKVTSQTVASTDDAVQAVTNVKRVSQRGKTLLDNGMDTAKNLASGNARTMGIAGAAALLGVGAFGMRRRSQEDIETKLNRQRYGEMR